jgi:hypothetical protein
MKPQKWGLLSTEHEAVYHAAFRCQAASLPLTPHRLHDGKKACSVQGKKRGGFASQAVVALSCSWGMGQLSCLEGGCIIALVLLPARKDDSHPDAGERANRFGVTLALGSFALLVVSRPGFREGRLPGELRHRIAQRFTTGRASMRFGIRSTLKDDWGAARESSQAGGVLRAISVIANFGEQARGEALASTRQGAEDFVVFMRQKKALNFLVIGSDLLDHRQELTDQSQHQARFGSGGHGIGSKRRLGYLLNDLCGCLLWTWIPTLFEQGLSLGNLGRPRCLQGRIGLQEQQGTALLHKVFEIEGSRKVGYASGCQLIDQPGLPLDQALLIAGQAQEFSNQGAIGLQLPQVGQFGSAMFGQHVGIHLVRFGKRLGTPSIHRFWMHGKHTPPGFQQRGIEPPMRGFDDAGHLFFGRLPEHVLQKRLQLLHSGWGVSNTKRTYLAAFFINDQGIMVRISPIYACIPHELTPFAKKPFLGQRVLLLSCSLKARSSHGRSSQEQGRRRTICLDWSSQVKGEAFRPPCSTVDYQQVYCSLRPSV